MGPKCNLRCEKSDHLQKFSADEKMLQKSAWSAKDHKLSKMKYRKFVRQDVAVLINFVVLCYLASTCGTVAGGKCVNHKSIFTSKTGIITDGPGSYPKDTNCEWLIRAPQKNQTITLTFTEFSAECSYDFLYVHDGPSYQSPLLGRFTGNNLPDVLTSTKSELLILLYSDYSIVNNGFSLAYEATDCPRKCSGHGSCINGKCVCASNHQGEFCEQNWCPNHCYSAISRGSCDLIEKRCKCNNGYSGQSCSLSSSRNSDLNSWHDVSSQSAIFEARSDHIAGYFKDTDALWIHGGRSLNGMFDDTIMYNITSNSWYDYPLLMPKPAARFQHAGDVYLHYLVLFGGELAHGNVSDELWMFDTITKTWRQPSGHDINKPYALAGHTANVIGSKLYIFGGRTEFGAFSTDVFQFDLASTSGWKKLTALNGKPSLYRLVGHSTVYNPYTNSLLIFGGEMAISLKNDSVKQNRLLSFSLDHHTWTELVPKKYGGNLLPTAVSFHSAVMAGDFMVVYGGIISPPSQTGNGCQSNELSYYNVRCNSWVPASILTAKTPAPAFNKPPTKGRYSHRALMRDNQTMLVTGGLNGVMKGDVIAYKIPKTDIYINSSSSTESENQCTSYTTESTCYQNLLCGWCFGDSKCYPTEISHQCTGLFHTANCESHCSAYQSCETCILNGNSSNQPCAWCVQDRKCYSLKAPQGRCSPDVAKLQIGWWGDSSNLLNSLEQCFIDNIPQGLTQVNFFSPVNRLFPDEVSIIESPAVSGISNNYDWRNKLRGFIYPYVLEANPSQSKNRSIFMSGQRISMRLFVANDHLEKSKVQAAYLPYSSEDKTVKASMPGAVAFFPSPSKNARYFMEAELNISRNNLYEGIISWNLNSSVAVTRETINASFLHPFYSNNCISYTTCMACIADAGCGWCNANDACIARASWSNCVASNGRVAHLAITQGSCFNCSDHSECMTCANNSLCAWTIFKCSRKGLYIREISSSSSCPSRCFSRSNCSSCLADNECRWCEKKKKCIDASNHMIEFASGECTRYQIRIGNIQCHSCSKHTTCTACLNDHRCGWCGNVDNPLIGLCREGDFAGPKTGQNCSLVMATNKPVDWSYDKCPDVDECRLKIHTCDSNAACFNSYGSYSCQCNRGYTGDGKSKCTKTCYHYCHHGHCGADYQCKCNLGWKGVNCSTDCGCNGHSTCEKGIGICDSCQEYTRGTYCDECVPGSFGNATSTVGCKPCLCNQHGDVSKGVCDRTTGKCFCKDFTTGDHCEECISGLAGDPRNGGLCHHECSSITFVKNRTFGNINSGTVRDTCLWVISAANGSNNEIIFGTKDAANLSTIVLSFSYLKLPCQDSHVYVYDGVPQGSVLTLSNFKLLAVICGYNARAHKAISSHSGAMTVLYKSFKQTGVTGTSFRASFNVFSCPDNCFGNRRCQVVNGLRSRCVCKPGWIGPLCDVPSCPQNCNNETGQGSCDHKKLKCVCSPGFTGKSCNETLSNKKFRIEKINLHGSNQPEKRFGHTFLYDEASNQSIIYGGRGLDSYGQLYGDSWSLSFVSEKFKEIVTRDQPSGRYYHCGVVHGGRMIIYGGITISGISNDLLLLNLSTGNWAIIEMTRPLPALFGQSCTLVGSSMFVIGGYSRSDDGLNEFTMKINLLTFSWEYLRVNGFGLTGVYGHSSVYDRSSGNIFVFGGIAFFEEKIQQSGRLYSLNVNTYTWNYLQLAPTNKSFQSYLHSATILDDVMYIIGGYSDVSNQGFNQDLLIWKMRCDQWSRVSLTDKSHVQGDSDVPLGIGLGMTAINKRFFVFGGFNGQLSRNIWKITLPNDICTMHPNQTLCLASFDCGWCQSSDLRNNGTCYNMNHEIPYPCNMAASNTVAPLLDIANTANFSENSTGIANDTNTTSLDWSIHHGTYCNISSYTRRPCSIFESCVSCLATFPGTTGPHCHWCVNQGCRRLGRPCTVQYDFTSINNCLEVRCEASSCENCRGTGECFWTGHYKYASETTRHFSADATYDWNCFRKSLEGRIKASLTDTSPQKNCPKKCVSYRSCSTCIASQGAEGGSKSCFWSGKLNLCLPVSRKFTACLSGDCAALYDKSTGCPAACSAKTTCQKCVWTRDCGWCAKPGNMGEGVCRSGGLTVPNSGFCNTSFSNDSSYSVWAPVVCPYENECLNGKHNCQTAEDCIDLENGFTCKCKKGHERNLTTNQCVPVCTSGCDQGRCIAPDVCRCRFGWVGANCSVACLCNGHSLCPNASRPDICLQCQNNTRGASCNKCLAGFVGDPTASKPCEPCSLHCHGRASICIKSSEAPLIPLHIQSNETLLRMWPFQIPKDAAEALCINCQGNSEGSHCGQCMKGYFERNRNCQPCLCNGHGETCDNTTGEGCKCTHNTETGECQKNVDCWKKQCSQCKKNFDGSPTNGRQCFQRLVTLQTHAIGIEKQDIGSSPTIEPIPPNRAFFFAVPPRFTNVDIRLTVDVFQGGVDLFISTSNAAFVIDTNYTTGDQKLLLREQARRRRDVQKDIEEDGSHLISVEEDDDHLRVRRSTPVSSTPVLPDFVVAASASQVSLFTEYIRGIFLVRGIQRRVVVSIPYKILNFSKDRFYVGVTTRGNDKNRMTAGIVYFRQDLAQIDLFVFFSVFFSVFFLILSSIFLIWKIKQLHSGRRAVIAQQMALESMASRPFACYQMLCERNEPIRTYRAVHKGLLEHSLAHSRKKDKQHYTIAPMAIQNTSDDLAAVANVFVQFPENEESPWNLAVCSAVVQAFPQHLLQISTNGDAKTPTRFTNTVTA